jgi:hypothetical protein
MAQKLNSVSGITVSLPRPLIIINPALTGVHLGSGSLCGQDCYSRQALQRRIRHVEQQQRAVDTLEQ